MSAEISDEHGPLGSPVSLAPYLPQRLLARLHVGDTQGTDRFEGASLLADLAGFTALGAKLAESGPAGAAQLTRILEACFGVMIDEILSSGGDVVCFAGDAVLAVWPAEDGSLADAARRAAETASSMVGLLKPIPEFREHGLRLRVGIGVGEAALLLMPAGAGHTYVVAGEAMRDAGIAEKAAKPGQIVLSARAAELCGAQGPELQGGNRVLGAAPLGYEALDESLGDAFPFDSMTMAGGPPGLAPVRPPREVADSVRRFLPPAVLRRSADDEWHAELRPVSAVFVNLPLLDPGRPDGEAELRSLLVRVGELLTRLEGTLDKVLVDEKGTTLVVAFGYPTLSHEDDAVRATRAAMAISETLTDRRIEHGIGVSTGRAFCGAYGCEQRREFTMLGDAVNLAARLMQQARGEVLCEQETVRAAISKVGFEPASQLQIRGRGGDVAVHRPLGALDATGRHEVLLTGRQEVVGTGLLDALTGSLEPDPSIASLGTHTADRIGPVDDQPGRLVGRDGELDALVEQLDALDDGRSGLVVLEGQPGAGKSLLLATLHGLARGRGCTVLVGAGDRVEARSPYHAWSEALRPLVAGVDDPEAHLLGLLGGEPDLQPWLPLVGPLLGVELAENDTTAAMSGAQRADAIRDLLRALLAATCRAGPTVVVLDDAHWLDPSSLSLAAAANGWARPLLLVLAGRAVDHELPAWERLMAAPGRVHLPLGSLSQAALLTLARRRFGARSLAQPVQRLILDRAGGSGFLCEELVLALSGSGQVVVVDGRADLAEGVTPTAVQLPDSVHGLVTGRIDRLGRKDQRTLKVCAVLGREFSTWRLRQIHPEQPDAASLDRQLQRLVDADLIAPAGRGDGYGFPQPLVQESAYQLLLPDRRRSLHAAVARSLEDDAAGRAIHPLRLAHHWRGAGEAARALTWLEQAGFDALRGGADREALTALDDAVDLASDLSVDEAPPVRVAELQRGRGMALQGLGDMEAGERALRQALGLLRRDLPTSTAGWAALLLREGLRQASHRFLPWLSRGSRDEARRRAAVVASQAAAWYANASYFLVEPLPWLAAGLLSANLAEQARDRSIAGSAYANLGVIFGTLKLRRAEEVYRRLTDESDEPRVRIIKEWARAVPDVARCDWDAARERIAVGLEQGRAYGDYWALSNGLIIDALIRYFTGPLPACLPPFEECRRMTRERDNREQEGYGLVFSVPALLSMGRLDDAEQQLDEAESKLDGLDYFSRVVFHGARCGLRMRQGRTDEAVEHARTSLDLYSAKPLMMFTYLGTFALVAEAMLQVDEPELRKRALANLAEGARLHWYFRPRSLLCQGIEAWEAGKERKAKALWDKGLAYASEYGMPWDEARLRAERARRGLEDPHDAAAALKAVGALGDRYLLDDVLPRALPEAPPAGAGSDASADASADASVDASVDASLDSGGGSDATAAIGRPDLFALGERWLQIYRGKLADHGMELPPDLALTHHRGVLCAYDRQSHELRLSVPDWNDPTAPLYVLFMGSMFSAESEDALVRFLTLFVPRVIAHELGHALRDHAGLFGENLWREEQIANELAVALQNHRLSPEDRAFFRSFVQRALEGIRAKVGSEDLAKNLYADVLHSTYAAGNIGTRTLETYELLGDLMQMSPTELLASGGALPDSVAPGRREADIEDFNAAYMKDQLSYFYFQLEWMNIDLMAQSERYLDQFARRWLNRSSGLLPTFEPEATASIDQVRAAYEAHRDCAGQDETASRYFYKRYRALLLLLASSGRFERGPWTDVVEQQGSFLLESWRPGTRDRLGMLASVVPPALAALFPDAMASSPRWAGDVELHLPQEADRQLWAHVCTKAGNKAAGSILRRLQLLETADLFASLPARVLLEAATRLSRVRFDAGEPVLWRGEHSNDVFIVLDGTLRWSVDEHRTGTIGGGHVVGEMAFLTDEPRSADVVAVTEVRAFVLEASDLRVLMHHHPSILLGIARELALRVAKANAGAGSVTGVDLTGVHPVLTDELA